MTKQWRLRPSQGGRVMRAVRPSDEIVRALRAHDETKPAKKPAKTYSVEFFLGPRPLPAKSKEIIDGHTYDAVGESARERVGEIVARARAIDDARRLHLPSVKMRASEILTFRVEVPALAGRDEWGRAMFFGHRVRAEPGSIEAVVEPAASSFSTGQVNEFMCAARWPRRLCCVAITAASSRTLVDGACLYLDRGNPITGDTFGDARFFSSGRCAGDFVTSRGEIPCDDVVDAFSGISIVVPLDVVPQHYVASFMFSEVGK